MRVGIGCDHAGFPLKQEVAEVAASLGHTVEDFGTFSTAPADYPIYARKVAEAVISGRCERGIVICGSGVGANVAANKIRGVRAALVADTYSAHQSREHDDCNVLCLGARVVGYELALEIMRAFVAARFTGEERHRRRLAKVDEIEKLES